MAHLCPGVIGSTHSHFHGPLPHAAHQRRVCYVLTSYITQGPPLTPSQVRRMSELSSLSVTVQERDFKMRPVSPNTQSAAGSLDMLFEEGKGNEIAVTLYVLK